MKINDTEYQLPEHIERYIIDIAEEAESIHNKATESLMAFVKPEVVLRRSGRTTRIIDDLIQILFIDGRVTVYDHVDKTEEHCRTARIMERRLKSEHPNRYVFDGFQTFTLPQLHPNIQP